MSLLELVVALPGSEEALPIPTWGYAALAFAFFLFLAFVVWSFRDVANRHSHKTGDSADHGTDSHGTPDHH